MNRNQRKNKVRQPDRRGNILSFHRGNRFLTSPHPPNFMSRPWFPLTVRIEAPSTTINYNQVRIALLTQLGFGAATNTLSVRFRSIRLWGPIPISPSPLIMIVYDLFHEPASGVTTDSVLEQITGYADGVNRAQVAYRFASVQQQHSLVIGSTTPQLLTSQVGAGPGSVVYIDLMWRLFSTAPEIGEDDLSSFINLSL